MSPRVLFSSAIALLLVPSGLLGAGAPAAARIEGLVLPFQQVAVSARIAGLIESVAVKEGDAVVAGQLLAQLTDAEEKLEVERTTRIVEVKTYDSKGTQELLKNDMVRKDEALEKKTEMEIAILQHRLAAVALARKAVRAPIAGIVVARKKEPGEWVEPGVEFFEIVSFDRVFVQILLAYEQAAPLRLAQTVEVELPQLAAPNVLAGKVDFIDPRVDAASGYQRVKILLDNPGRRILPGTRGLVHLPAAKP